MAALIWVKAPLPGEWDGWIAPEDLRTMADAMSDCRLVFVPRVRHSMNLELPALHAGYFGGIAAQEFLKQGRVPCQNR